MAYDWRDHIKDHLGDIKEKRRAKIRYALETGKAHMVQGLQLAQIEMFLLASWGYKLRAGLADVNPEYTGGRCGFAYAEIQVFAWGEWGGGRHKNLRGIDPKTEDDPTLEDNLAVINVTIEKGLTSLGLI